MMHSLWVTSHFTIPNATKLSIVLTDLGFIRSGGLPPDYPLCVVRLLDTFTPPVNVLQYMLLTETYLHTSLVCRLSVHMQPAASPCPWVLGFAPQRASCPG